MTDNKKAHQTNNRKTKAPLFISEASSLRGAEEGTRTLTPVMGNSPSNCSVCLFRHFRIPDTSAHIRNTRIMDIYCHKELGELQE
jgi:hypothetical protein